MVLFSSFLFNLSAIIIANIFEGSASVSVPRRALTTLYWSTEPKTLQLPNGAEGESIIVLISILNAFLNNFDSKAWISSGSIPLGIVNLFSWYDFRISVAVKVFACLSNTSNRSEFKSDFDRADNLSTIFLSPILFVILLKISLIVILHTVTFKIIIEWLQQLI